MPTIGGDLSPTPRAASHCSFSRFVGEAHLFFGREGLIDLQRHKETPGSAHAVLAIRVLHFLALEDRTASRSLWDLLLQQLCAADSSPNSAPLYCAKTRVWGSSFAVQNGLRFCGPHAAECAANMAARERSDLLEVQPAAPNAPAHVAAAVTANTLRPLLPDSRALRCATVRSIDLLQRQSRARRYTMRLTHRNLERSRFLILLAFFLQWRNALEQRFVPALLPPVVCCGCPCLLPTMCRRAVSHNISYRLVSLRSSIRRTSADRQHVCGALALRSRRSEQILMALIKKRSGAAAMAWTFRQWAKFASAHHAELTAEETTALKYKLREEAEARAQADRLLQVDLGD